MKRPPIGQMQSRLSPPPGNMVQYFPEKHWADEFPAAREAGFDCIEWTYDINGNDVNPLSNEASAALFAELKARHGIAVDSLCANYFVHRPLLKGSAAEQAERRENLLWLLRRCRALGIGRVVLPFLDASTIEDPERRPAADLLRGVIDETGPDSPEIALETDLPPTALADLLAMIDRDQATVNYDSGNSASLGFNADEEFAAYGSKIKAVHIKDRVRGGSNVPLGTGSTDFQKFLRNLDAINYQGKFILEICRSKPGDEIAWSIANRNFVEAWFR
jgi:hexulose-6-phosphate isomerase